MIPITIQTRAARQAADDARIAAARAAKAVRQVNTPDAAPVAPAPLLTLEQIIARNAAREAGIPIVDAAPAPLPRREPYAGWGAPLPKDRLTVPDIYRPRRGPACKRSAPVGTWQSCNTTRVHFSHG